MTEISTGSIADRSFDILESVSDLGVCRVSAIARRTGLPTSTVHRAVARLVGRRYLFSPKPGHYMIGETLDRLGRNAGAQTRLAETARPLLETLSQKTGLHTHFGILTGEMVTYMVICVNGQHPISRIEGTQLEAYCSGIGKALIAHESADKRAEYLSRNDFVSITDNTITDPGKLDRHLAMVRENGFALDDEEIVPGLRCVAIPIFDQERRAIAAISASGAANFVTGRKITSIRSALQKIARHLAIHA